MVTLVNYLQTKIEAMSQEKINLQEKKLKKM